MEQLALPVCTPPAAIVTDRRALLDDPDWLRTQYARRTLPDIAGELGCSPTTVGARLHMYGIRPRRPGEKPPAPGTPVEQLLQDRVKVDVARGDVGRTVLAQRIRAFALAEKAGDSLAMQAALVDLGAASVAWAQGMPGDTPRR